jgi:hypothetical protein
MCHVLQYVAETEEVLALMLRDRWINGTSRPPPIAFKRFNRTNCRQLRRSSRTTPAGANNCRPRALSLPQARLHRCRTWYRTSQARRRPAVDRSTSERAPRPASLSMYLRRRTGRPVARAPRYFKDRNAVPCVSACAGPIDRSGSELSPSFIDRRGVDVP